MSATAQEPSAPVVADPASFDEDSLRRECEAFAIYLGHAPGELVQRHYLRFHQERGLAPRDAFDAHVYAFGRRGGLALRLADAYLARLRPAALLRAKLTLVMGLLECDPSSVEIFEQGRARSTVGFFLRLLGRALVHGLLFGLSVPRLLPAQLLLGGKAAKGAGS